MFPDKAIDGRVPSTVWSQDVYNTHIEKLPRCVEIAARDELFSDPASDFACEEAIGAHPREKIEQDLRKTHSARFLGDKNRRRERAFESTAERVSLHQCNRR